MAHGRAKVSSKEKVRLLTSVVIERERERADAFFVPVNRVFSVSTKRSWPA